MTDIEWILGPSGVGKVEAFWASSGLEVWVLYPNGAEDWWAVDVDCRRAERGHNRGDGVQFLGTEFSGIPPHAWEQFRRTMTRRSETPLRALRALLEAK